MNERIVKLFMESVDSNYIPVPIEDHIPSWTEKFAELIVRKCMDVAKYHTPDTEECEYTWLIHNKIAKYFGVEE